MRVIVSLLIAVCFIAAVEANATGVAMPQSQAAPSAPKPNIIDMIRQPCCFVRSWQATARPRVSGSAVSSSATLDASNLTLPWETLGGYCFRLWLRADWGAIWPTLAGRARSSRVHRQAARARLCRTTATQWNRMGLTSEQLGCLEVE
jgi:hypothetical protein